MAETINQRMTVEADEVVVFLIGMRINKLWKIGTWLPVMTAMPRMLVELGKNPDLGLLHARSHFGIRNVMVVQYWKDFDALHAYATNKTAAHLPAWQAFNQKIASNGDVGIWHETYVTDARNFECVYNNMPPYGLGKAHPLVPITGRNKTARGRLKQTDGTDSPSN